jgi:hypothetical protein
VAAERAKVAGQSNRDEKEWHEKAVTDGSKSAFNKWLELGTRKDIAPQICACDSRNTAQLLRANRIKQHERQHAACYSFVGIEFAEQAHQWISPTPRCCVKSDKVDSNASRDQRHLHH